MQKKGKFILFSPAEFNSWLPDHVVDRVIKLVQNHHTFVPNYSTFTGNNHFQLLQGMENSHIQRGFNEIGQNLTTFPDGNLAVCRDFDIIPAGIKGANKYGICIEHVGNFEIGRDRMSEAHKDAIIGLNAWLCQKFFLRPSIDTIVYHYWYDLNTGERKNGQGTTKSCPGSNFFGGNQVAVAQANFIPLIEKVFQPRSEPQPRSSGSAEISSASSIYSRPDSNAPVVKKLPRGIVVAIYEQRGSWYKIHPTAAHWIAARNVAFTSD